MAYFDQITPPLNNQNLPLDRFALTQQLIERVEKRAMDVINEKYPYMRELTNVVIIDPYANYSPDDHDLWLTLLQMAEGKNRELYARLFYLRGTGTKLVSNPQWGFVFQPVIGDDGWSSMEQYNQEKTCLNNYGQQVIELLRLLTSQLGGN